ncbi:pentapeptide repeat-containing protein [Actinomadura graeca]|uniref:Pentapeptide repeat-containing protein n=1 Tax=Actinomadura graeca TaxID=2750812 RepID=A0ABX8R451_9ACTN|nr:pentapeptide repeat-containing protein [Actinomadura graeca]QXJ25830.1 pentapeptide repeat-containing protein [Actinomadura graeca]
MRADFGGRRLVDEDDEEIAPSITRDRIHPYADLTDADLTDANLKGANLTGADLNGAHLTRANLVGEP